MVMSQYRTPRLKPLLDTVPPGFIVDTGWLRARGIDPKSIHNYVARGWLERVVHGVYRRPLPLATKEATEEPWGVLLLSLQRLMNHSVHLGGESALDVMGHVHYLSLTGLRRVFLYGEVPSWVRRMPMKTEIVARRRSLFGESQVGIEESDAITRSKLEVWRWPALISSPERAILEALEELPRNASFENIDKVFEGLTTLRPDRLNNLLAACHSVKVLRLFFVFADRHEHGWRKHLDTSRLNLGSGPRALVDGGKIHPTYQIVVPEELIPGSHESIEQNG